MKYIINTLTKTIKEFLSSGKKVILKLEGFDDIRIYSQVCTNIDALCKRQNISVIMKLSQEKFEEFKEQNQHINELNTMQNNHWVNFENTMTYYRNLVSNSSTTKMLILMGTEMVQDKGGIHDIDTYTPQTLEKSIQSNCFELFNLENLNDKTLINNIYKQLFDRVPINIYKLSAFADLHENITDTQELVKAIFKELPLWGLPMWVNNIPKSSSFLKSNKNQFDALAKFIERKKFTAVSEKEFLKVQNKIKSFQESSQDVVIDWQEQSAVFTNFQDYSQCLLEYVLGKNIQSNKQKLLYTDYSIAKNILNLKDTSSTTTKNTKQDKYTLKDTPPIVAILKMILYSIVGVSYDDLLSINSLEINIDSIELSTNSTKFSDESSEDVLLKHWQNICMVCDNVIDYVANSMDWSICDMPNIEIVSLPRGVFSYENAKDLIDKQRILEKNTTKKLNKINATVKLFNSNKEPIYRDGTTKDTTFVWQFKNSEPWLKSFKDIPQILEKFSMQTNAIIPFGTTMDIQQLVNIEDDEMFFDYLDEINIEYSNLLEYIKDIGQYNRYYESFENLGKAFMDFCNSVTQVGFFSDMLDSSNSKLNALVSRYISTGELLKNDTLNGEDKLYINEYIHAFAIEKDTSTIDTRKKDTKCCIIPPFHPCTLEKLKAKYRFILDGTSQFWNETVNHSLDRNANAFTITDIDKTLEHLDELSKVCFSIDVYSDEKHNYYDSSNSFGHYSIYRSNEVEESLYSRNILNKDFINEDGVTSETKIEETPESTIYLDILKDYKNAFPNRANNLSLVFVNSLNIKPIVSAIYYYIKGIQDSDDYKDIKSIKLDILILPKENENNIKIYLSYWINKYFPQSNDISMKIKVKSFKSKNVESYIPNNVDIIFYSKILQTDEIQFKEVVENLNENLKECDFPIIIKPYPSYVSDGNRYIEISQNRFKASWVHTQLERKFKEDTSSSSNWIAVKKLQLPQSMVDLLNTLHEKSFWNVCIDNGLDKSLMCNSSSNYSIVGYSTGKGSQGQYNVTITARKSLIEQLKLRLKYRLRNLFHWEDTLLNQAVERCVEQSSKLDGLKMFKSINIAERNIREHMAYILTSLYVEKYYNSSVNTLVSLDSYIHWFTGVSDTNLRPDFLYLQIDFTPSMDVLNIQAEVIECKISSYENKDSHINKAIEQVKNGLRVLSKLFDSTSKSIERRNWYSQLYRVLTFQKFPSYGDTQTDNKFKELLRGILLGNFKISWKGKILGYWYNMDGKDIISESVEDIEILNVPQCEMQSLLLGKNHSDTISYVENSTFEPTTTVDIQEPPQPQIEPPLEEQQEEIVEEQQEEEVSISTPTTTTENTDSTNIPESSNTIKFLIGNNTRNQPIYWHFDELANRHLLITGTSGQGKTYAIQTLLAEASKNGISSIIVDYSDSYTNKELKDGFKDVVGDKLQNIVVYDGIHINPFKIQQISLDGTTRLEKLSEVANRVAGIFKQVYKLGDQQLSVIYRACLEGLKHHQNYMSFDILRQEIENIGDTVAKSVNAKLMPFFDGEYIKFEKSIEWKELSHNNGSVTVIQLSNISTEIRVAITEFILWDMWYYMVNNSTESTPFIVVLDEAQNLSFKENSPNEKILREGRKFGWSAWYSTQFLSSQRDGDESTKLNQSATKIFFKPTNNDIDKVAKMVDRTKYNDWIPVLSRLSKGKCIVNHQEKNDVVTVTSFEDRKELK